MRQEVAELKGMVAAARREPWAQWHAATRPALADWLEDRDDARADAVRALPGAAYSLRLDIATGAEWVAGWARAARVREAMPVVRLLWDGHQGGVADTAVLTRPGEMRLLMPGHRASRVPPPGRGISVLRELWVAVEPAVPVLLRAEFRQPPLARLWRVNAAAVAAQRRRDLLSLFPEARR